MNNTEKHYSLEINSEGLNYYVEFNNVTTFNATGNAPTKESIPVNQWSLNGDNNLLVSVNLKDEDPDNKLKTAKIDKLTISLVLTEINNNQKTKHTITTFDLLPSKDQPNIIASSSTSNYRISSKDNYKQSENGDIVISKWDSEDEDEWKDFKQTITINTGLPEWVYLSADDLGNDQTLSDEDYYSLLDGVYKALENIWSLMEKKDLVAILELNKIRSSEFDTAYYLKPGSKQKEMEQSLTSAFNHKDLYLDKLVSKSRANMVIEANGKIVKLEVQKIGGPMMFYSHKDEAFTRYYDFYFMKKDGKLIIVR